MSPAGPGTWRRTHAAMGTVVSIAFSSAVHADAEVARIIDGACAVIDEAERVFTTFDPASPLCAYRAGRRVGPAERDRIEEVLGRCVTLRELSGGWFDPWAGPAGLDPSGYVKGWAVGEALARLAAAGPSGAFVGAGGDIAVVGAPPAGGPWRIGITHPWTPGAFAGVVAVDAAIATSGNYARRGQLYDPRSGAISETVPSATVVGVDPGDVDAFATALAVGGRAAARHLDGLPGVEYHLIEADGTETASPGLRFVDPRVAA